MFVDSKNIFHFRPTIVLLALLLAIPLPPQLLAELELRATTHDFGYKYLYLADIYFFKWRVFEACLFWLPQDGKTGQHDHQGVINGGKIIRGAIIEETARVTRNEIKVMRQRKISADNWLKSFFRTAPYQIHQLVGASEEMAVALSMYFPGRDY